MWGPLRGGTQAQLVDGQYLGFFHSYFIDSRKVAWYLMGAYTFEAEPPFRITGISPYPILFDGIYETEPKNTSCLDKYIIYPAGFVTEERDGKKVIQVTCGENDSAIKVVSFDQEQLLKSLKKIHHSNNLKE